LEDFYTVEDIALMLRVTTRTVRNYLKDGTLKGRKIGGGWRFTDDDLSSLFSNTSVLKDQLNQDRQDVVDFLDGVYPEIDGEIQICTVIDVYHDSDATMKLRDAIIRLVDKDGKCCVSFTYLESENKARFTLFGSHDYIGQVMDIIRRDEG